MGNKMQAFQVDVLCAVALWQWRNPSEEEEIYW
jgi:hypothetical protein